MCVAGEGEECARVRVMRVPALINSINLVCLRASVKKRWLPRISLSGERWILSSWEFVDMISSVVFHTAGSRARKLFRFGAMDNASAKREVVASDDNRNLSSTVS